MSAIDTFPFRASLSSRQACLVLRSLMRIWSWTRCRSEHHLRYQHWVSSSICWYSWFSLSDFCSDVRRFTVNCYDVYLIQETSNRTLTLSCRLDSNTISLGSVTPSQVGRTLPTTRHLDAPSFVPALSGTYCREPARFWFDYWTDSVSLDLLQFAWVLVCGGARFISYLSDNMYFKITPINKN